MIHAINRTTFFFTTKCTDCTNYTNIWSTVRVFVKIVYPGARSRSFFYHELHKFRRFHKLL